MSDTPNVGDGQVMSPSSIANTAAIKATDVPALLQQPEYVDGTLPLRIMKMHPGGGYTAEPGVDYSAPPPPPPPPSDIANVDDPTSGGGGDAGGGGGAPVNINTPVVSQTEGVLNCTMGNWQGEPTSYDYVWKLDGATVGANSNGYTITIDDIGKSATCDVTATNAAGSTAAPTSTAVTIADPTVP